MNVQAIRYRCGDGKVFYSREVSGPVVQKIAANLERLNRGIREMELVEMTEVQWRNLPMEQVATVIIGS